MAKTLAEQLDELTGKVTGFFTTEKGELKAQVETLTKGLAAAEAKAAKAVELEEKVKAQGEEITKLKADLEAATKKAEAAEAKAKETEASVEARANQKALAMEQKRGLTAPVQEEEKANGGGKTKAQEYRELLAQDPAKAGAFFAKHQNEIFGS